ncbi:uncharacterized protein [Argopecten irradians]|uniref:uncharacterized protein n=1 Tax=Argopecten irradians TaxID=31199 RepID=UPI003711D26B
MAKVAVTPHEIGELKSLLCPPKIIKDILAAVMILIGEPNPRDYVTAQKVLNLKCDNSLIQRISTLDVASIAQEEVVKARGLVDGLTIDIVRNNNLAVCNLFCWVQEVLPMV